MTSARIAKEEFKAWLESLPEDYAEFYSDVPSRSCPISCYLQHLTGNSEVQTAFGFWRHDKSLFVPLTEPVDLGDWVREYQDKADKAGAFKGTFMPVSVALRILEELE